MPRAGGGSSGRMSQGEYSVTDPGKPQTSVQQGLLGFPTASRAMLPAKNPNASSFQSASLNSSQQFLAFLCCFVFLLKLQVAPSQVRSRHVREQHLGAVGQK